MSLVDKGKGGVGMHNDEGGMDEGEMKGGDSGIKVRDGDGGMLASIANVGGGGGGAKDASTQTDGTCTHQHHITWSFARSTLCLL